jgi:hypothetical protein
MVLSVRAGSGCSFQAYVFSNFAVAAADSQLPCCRFCCKAWAAESLLEAQSSLSDHLQVRVLFQEPSHAAVAASAAVIFFLYAQAAAAPSRRTCFPRLLRHQQS